MASLRFDCVSRVWPGGVKALDEVSFYLGEGERVAVIGPSGSGKSTLARLAVGLDQPTAGVIHVDDAVSRPVIGYADVDCALYPHMTVERNLMFRYRQVCNSHDRQFDVPELCDVFRLNHVRARLPAQLSSGERQRVSLARAFAAQPSMVVLDEPLSHVDPLLRADLSEVLEDAWTACNVTSLVITHDHEDAIRFGQQIAVLGEGRLQQIGTAHQLMSQPANSFVAGFFGSDRMNLLRALVEHDGVVTSDSHDPEDRTILGRLPHAATLSPGAITIGVRPTSAILGSENEAAAPTHEGLRMQLNVDTCFAIGNVLSVTGRDTSGSLWRLSLPNVEGDRSHTKISARSHILVKIAASDVFLFAPGAYGRALPIRC
ncbi:MAG: ABC transporter ATP-binding protein [Phycisphaerales bacterium]